MNNRRKLVITLGAGVLAAPFRSLAQQQRKVWRVGYITSSDPAATPYLLDAFRVGMREHGYSARYQDFGVDSLARGQSD